MTELPKSESGRQRTHMTEAWRFLNTFHKDSPRASVPADFHCHRRKGRVEAKRGADRRLALDSRSHRTVSLSR